MDGMQREPYEVVTLFDGTSLEGWTHKDGSPAQWDLAEGVMTVRPGTGNIVSRETYRDCYLHVEFRCPVMPEATGQAKGNSGVYVQGRYEIQVLDSSGWAVPGLGDCGAIYNQHAPLVNVCQPGGEWQTYIIIFRAPRFGDSGEMIEDARMTVFLNSVLIHNNVQMRGITGGPLDDRVAEPGPLMLQDHRDLVSYRTIWLVHLPEEGSSEYGPR